uniref:Chromosome IX lambda clone 4554 n=1 Tax=Saccharomyces cerevisiae (strain ATCC 204508 / S288c) TaxID=559292 RepID=E9PAD8_YEAST|nr:unnamed protein product [Saccharomyces cerevisiae]
MIPGLIESSSMKILTSLGLLIIVDTMWSIKSPTVTGSSLSILILCTLCFPKIASSPPRNSTFTFTIPILLLTYLVLVSEISIVFCFGNF